MTLEQKLNLIPVDDLKFYMKNGKGSNELFGMQCTKIYNLEWYFVKVELPDLINSGKFTNIIKLLFNASDFEVSTLEVSEVLPFLVWLIDSVKEIMEMEVNHLSSDPDSDMLRAGIDKLNDLGIYNTIDLLASGDITKYEQVKKIKYYEVFTKLKKNTIDGAIQKEFNRIQQEKSKNRK